MTLLGSATKKTLLNCPNSLILEFGDHFLLVLGQNCGPGFWGSYIPFTFLMKPYKPDRGLYLRSKRRLETHIDRAPTVRTVEPGASTSMSCCGVYP